MFRIVRFYYKNYRNEMYLAVGLIIVVVSLFVGIFKGLLTMNFIYISGIGLGIGSLSIFLLQYLSDNATKNSRVSVNRASDSISDFEALSRRLTNIELRFHEQVDSIKETNTIDIEKIIQVTIDKELDSNNFISLVNSKYPQQIDIQRKISFLKDDLVEVKQRIDIEINRLRKSANLNLVVGTMTTLIAVAILGFEVLRSELKFNELISLLSHYIPRITIVIFVEIFAFFFLKMYRNNLVDIKYFHNEKTNIELKIISLKTAIINDSEAILSLCIQELIKTERNFVLNKNQSTIDLEKEKIESSYYKNIAEALTGFMKSNK